MDFLAIVALFVISFGFPAILYFFADKDMRVEMTECAKTALIHMPR